MSAGAPGGVCEGIREAARRTGIRPRVVAPTLRENLEDFLALTAQQGYDAIVLAGIGFRAGRPPATRAVTRTCRSSSSKARAPT